MILSSVYFEKDHQKDIILLQTIRLHADLVQHKHLENNILIPKAVEMEKELLQL